MIRLYIQFYWFENFRIKPELRFEMNDIKKGHDKLVFKLVKNNLVTPSVSDVSVSYAVS